MRCQWDKEKRSRENTNGLCRQPSKGREREEEPTKLQGQLAAFRCRETESEGNARCVHRETEDRYNRQTKRRHYASKLLAKQAKEKRDEPEVGGKVEPEGRSEST